MEAHLENNTIDTLFKRSMTIELLCAKVYRQIAQLFRDNNEIALFWHDLENDELTHAEILKETRSALSSQQLDEPVDEKKLQELQGIQKKLNANMNEIIETLDDAYELAHDIEFSEVNSIFLFLTIDSVPQQKRNILVQKVISEHQDKLLSFSEKYGDCEWRIGITAIK